MKPCKKCGCKEITLWDCGYSSFNPGGGKCNKCGFRVKDEAGCLPTAKMLEAIWNRGQGLIDKEKLKILRKQIRSMGLKPKA